ncbi:hypothetical protein [Streptomyces spectabilis]|uniref:Uncharacterized protein n=1 Tax=Streptomyces spectabilis TaxID=68270 RepID=A0A7W8ET91_STRST|nr:hypothetical protein [Streptomyces spectabilis]MBB5104547.1 hypothetical protein [Streptomyces spectabilis]MCI3905098.1 hypothetical protein [Streptomyces spectabilis]GGV00676.1 hypothetical protein GCM10010245_04060 [Streptomyces spectabilis]
MHADKTPQYAKLKAGVTGKDLLEAVVRSGYPLQATVAETLKEAAPKGRWRGEIQEEWAYVDRDSGQVRALDVFADIPLSHSAEKEGEFQTRAKLNTLIECKQSELPYVFFLRHDPPQDSTAFPEIVGTAGPDVRVFPSLGSDGTGPDFSYLMSVHDALACHEFEIFDNPPFHAISLTKAARHRGGKLELTGEDAYRSLTLPLLKAADHLIGVSDSRDRKSNPIRFIAPFAVLDAPMIGTVRHEGRNVFLALPWVRMSYLEPFNDREAWNQASSRVRYFDVVHASCLEKYLHVLFDGIQKAADRAMECGPQLKEGVAVIDNGEEYSPLKSLEEDRRQYLDWEPAGRIFRQSDGHALGFLEGAEFGEEDILTIGWNL